MCRLIRLHPTLKAVRGDWRDAVELSRMYGRAKKDCSERMRVHRFRGPNDIEFSGERKRVRCNEGLGPRGKHEGKREEGRNRLTV